MIPINRFVFGLNHTHLFNIVYSNLRNTQFCIFLFKSYLPIIKFQSFFPNYIDFQSKVKYFLSEMSSCLCIHFLFYYSLLLSIHSISLPLGAESWGDVFGSHESTETNLQLGKVDLQNSGVYQCRLDTGETANATLVVLCESWIYCDKN